MKLSLACCAVLLVFAVLAPSASARAKRDNTPPGSFYQLTPPGTSSIGIYTPPGTQTWTVVAVDRAGNSSGPSNAVTLTVVTDPNLC
jgi:hypothetical protein